MLLGMRRTERVVPFDVGSCLFTINGVTQKLSRTRRPPSILPVFFFYFELRLVKQALW